MVCLNKLFYFKDRQSENSLSESQKDYYNKLRSYYNFLKTAFDEFSKKVELEVKPHPYKKFFRGENDKLYHSFVTQTERFEKKEKK